jgi:peptidoglycan pentaglycine glycine transferase (the first glycine)
MAKWQLLEEHEALKIWDQALLRFPDSTPFQSYAWGEYRRALGWKPLRWIALNESGEIVAMMLGSLRRYPFGAGFVWSEGGPVGDLSVCDESLHKAIRATTGLRWVYCRFRCDRQRQVVDALRLTALGWYRSWFNLTPNYSMVLDLRRDEAATLAGCEQNWRRNLRRANEGKLTVSQWLDPNVDEVLSIYASMQSLKGLEEQLSRAEAEHLLRNFKDRLVLYRCDNEQGELVSLLGWVVFGNRAWAVFWATSELGRKLHASYAIFWALVRHCQKLQLQACDLAGIDPIRNQGVYRFKKATGATPLEYLGEWEWATAPWLRWLGNWAISRRERLKFAESSLKRTAEIRAKPLVSHVSASEQPPPMNADRLQVGLGR